MMLEISASEMSSLEDITSDSQTLSLFLLYSEKMHDYLYCASLTAWTSFITCLILSSHDVTYSRFFIIKTITLLDGRNNKSGQKIVIFEMLSTLDININNFVVVILAQ